MSEHHMELGVVAAAAPVLLVSPGEEQPYIGITEVRVRKGA